MGKVIILEDDRAFSLALASLLIHEGVDVATAGRPQEALELIQANVVDFLLVDCLLPEENGVDFIVRNRQIILDKKIKIILMSGILTDSNFIRDSLRQTKAIEFLKKPFASPDLLKILGPSRKAAAEILQPRQNLYQLMSKEIITVREQRKAIEALDTVHGFDLPYIYSLLVRTELSGHLNVVRNSGEVFSVTFCKGQISGVDIDDQETLLGKLLIESGYVLPDDLQSILKTTPNPRKIGERLVAENLLSPHGLEKVLAAQMSLRLSRTILDENFKLNFSIAELAPTPMSIDRETFQRFLHDWIASKVTLSWLKAHFTRSITEEIIPGPMYTPENAVLRSPIVRGISGDFWKEISETKNVFKLLQANPAEEEVRAKALFFLLVEGLITFHKNETRSNENLVMLLQKVWQQLGGKTENEIRDLIIRMTGGIDPTPAQVQKDFLRLIGRKDEAIAAGQGDLYIKITSKLQSAFAQAGTAEVVPTSTELSHNMIKLEGFRRFETAYQELQNGNFKKALDFFKEAEAQDPKIAKLNLYICWAKIGLNDRALAKEIDMLLMMIPPEDKYDATYAYILGLYARNKNEMNQARKYFEKALALDNHFILARREVARLQTDNPGKQDIFTGDLTAVVANLFQKKKA